MPKALWQHERDSSDPASSDDSPAAGWSRSHRRRATDQVGRLEDYWWYAFPALLIALPGFGLYLLKRDVVLTSAAAEAKARIQVAALPISVAIMIGAVIIAGAISKCK